MLKIARNSSRQVASIGLTACLLLSAGGQPVGAELRVPALQFDRAVTASALEPGTCTLKGYLAEQRRNPNTLKTKVMLFPCTPYFEEYLALRKRHRGEAMMAGEAYTYRIEGNVFNQDASFEFSNLKPGKYFLTCDVTAVSKESYDVQTGTEYVTTTQYMGTNPIGESTEAIPLYTTYSYLQSGTSEKTAIVTISADGQTVNVKL